MTLRTTPGADNDVSELAAHLEIQRTGRGTRFLSDYRTAAENIERFPQMYPLVDDEVPGVEVRNAILERFELRVLYVIRQTEAVIIAVVHGRRMAASWHDRLSDAFTEE
jgi:plasmid stabilization system protein ParE